LFFFCYDDLLQVVACSLFLQPPFHIKLRNGGWLLLSLLMFEVVLNLLAAGNGWYMRRGGV